jgi:hypothetical protein
MLAHDRSYIQISAVQIPKLIMYRRYRDDISIHSEAEEKDLKSFLEKINKIHESLKFTIEISNH